MRVKFANVWYTCGMTVPGTVDNSTSLVVNSQASTQVDPVVPTLYPTSVSGPQSAAVHALGEVLKTLIHNSHFFPTENAVDSAMSAVDKWVSTSVKSSELGAILTGNERAAKEDVTKRIPPGGPNMVAVGPQIDYRQLAEAIIAAQQRLALEGGSE